ncbi:MAG TPA: PBP1A family penicillin-binding protein [Acidimicrobiales bacterium]|nr:PBP1A family penicillin-binding protein [Acidimicrobiales bacterium]
MRVHGAGATGRVLARWVFTSFLAALGLASGLLLASRPAKAILASAESSAEPTQLELNQLSLRSVVYDRSGGVLAVLHHDENRSPIPLDQIPEHVVNAVLAVEDDSFFQHDGVNVRSILRAAITNAEAGSVRQGGSTITQQLVKQSLLSPEKNLERKVKEAVYAIRLEEQMTKEEILEAYLNTVYFGNGAYGVQAAAETYWGVQAKDLTIEQGAFLAGIIQNPSNYDPFRNGDRGQEMRERAAARRNFALQRMVVKGHITQQEAEFLRGIPVPEGQRKKPLQTRDDYFVEEVKQALLDDPQYNLGGTYEDRFNAIFRGGLRIETTFDPRLQEAAQKAVNTQIPNTNGRFVGALASVEPSTGAVRAMVSNLNFEEAKYNLVTGRGGSGRQPGSSFKAIVLLAALEEGMSPNDTIAGSEPCKVTGIKGLIPDPYEPGNYEGSKGSNGPLYKATAQSLNCAYIRLGLSLADDPIKSLTKVKDMANRLGLDKVNEPVVSMSLGAKEATPLQMASAYATIANDGVRHKPYFIQRVLDRDGKVVYERKNEGERVVEPNVARAATWTLQHVVNSGTGTRARLPGREVAGKTGTSQEWRDAWFVGYTPQLATAVWMGNPNKQDEMKSVGGIRVTGGSYPARTWNAFMTEALKGQPALKFPPPNLDEFGKPTSIKPPKQVTGGSSTTKKPTSRRTPSSTPPEATTSNEKPDKPEKPSSDQADSGGE